jgi:hypothetical protein
MLCLLDSTFKGELITLPVSVTHHLTLGVAPFTEIVPNLPPIDID